MILVGQYDSPYVRRVAVTLHHYGIPFTRNPISVFSDAANMARINPLVRIPSLVLEGGEEDGEVVIDSSAIIDYLDELAGPQKALTPRWGAERRHVMQLVAIACGAIDKIGALVYERHFHKPEAVSEAWAERCKSQFLGGINYLERRLEGDWLFGERFTQADLTTATLLSYVRLRAPELSLERLFPCLSRLSERCEAMPAFKAALPSPDEVMPAEDEFR